jgi:ribonuclease BN (tRNA processing enzyme)
MRLTILGSGDAFGAGGRLNSCYLLESGPARFMVDCGATVLVGLHRAGLTSNDISTIFISHLHGDHFGGLPFFFIDALFPRQRITPLTLIGPLGLENRFRLACEVFYPRVAATPLAFDLRFIELETGITRDIDGVSITPFAADHYAGSVSHSLRFEHNGKVFAFSGDTSWTPSLIEAAKNADLFLTECYQYDMQLAMHIDYTTLEKQHNAIGARRTMLTHMSDTMLASQHLVDKSRYELAEDGLVVDF